MITLDYAFWRQVQADYAAAQHNCSVLGICDASVIFIEAWLNLHTREQIARHAREFLDKDAVDYFHVPFSIECVGLLFTRPVHLRHARPWPEELSLARTIRRRFIEYMLDQSPTQQHSNETTLQ